MGDLQPANAKDALAIDLAAEPAVTIDPASTIVGWNRAAASLFGFESEEAIGRKCWQLLRGRDHVGNRYCCENCPQLRMAARREAIKPCGMSFADARSATVRARVHSEVRAAEHGSAFRLVHRFRVDEVAPRRVPARSTDSLTARESEVLALLSEGRRTAEIAASLDIRETTVRNHVHNVLHKLAVHSRLEAVCEARRLGFIEPAFEP